MTIAESVCAMPAAPRTAEDTGVGADMILQLIMRTMYFAGELTGSEVAARLGVPFAVVDPSLVLMRRDHLCEIAGGTLLGPLTYRYRLTDAGRTRAMLFLDQNQYVSCLPVPLDQYATYMRTALREAESVTRQSIRRAFSHLVLSDGVIDQLGPAIAAHHSLFIYGPPGNGKTMISQSIRNVLPGGLAIPHALSIDGQICRMFDPVIHQPLEAVDGADSDQLAPETEVDRRWVPCRRPLVTVGGELTLDSLDLSYSSTARFYRAPVHVLANGGVLVVDDFGRQRVSTREMLNRWIVPLESRKDYLTLHTGQKFELALDLLIVFATNMKPYDLVDEAFLRRIHYKVFAESPTAEEFTQIFEKCCRERQIAFDPRLVEELIANEIRPRGIELRGCQPRDLVDHALWLARYLDQPRALTGDLISAACASYFLEDHEAAKA